MKNYLLISLFSVILLFGCQKNNNQPAPAQNTPQNNQNNVQNTQTCTLSVTEGSLVGKWYYERMEALYNGSVSSVVSTYSGNPEFNTISFTGSLSAMSIQDSAAYPNFKSYSRIMNGNPITGGVWKVVPSTGALMLAPTQINTTIIDSLTGNRFVYEEGSGYPVITSGYRYHLHR